MRRLGGIGLLSLNDFFGDQDSIGRCRETTVGNHLRDDFDDFLGSRTAIEGALDVDSQFCGGIALHGKRGDGAQLRVLSSSTSRV